MPGIFYQLEIQGSLGYALSPLLFIFFHGMAAKIHAQHFFFKCQLRLLLVLSHIWKRYVKLCLLILIHHIEQRHLSGHGIFPFLVNLIQNLHVDDHKLLPGPTQAVKCA